MIIIKQQIKLSTRAEGISNSFMRLMYVDGWMNLGLMLAKGGKNLAPSTPPPNDAGVAEARYGRWGRESVHIRKGLAGVKSYVARRSVA